MDYDTEVLEPEEYSDSLTLFIFIIEINQFHLTHIVSFVQTWIFSISK